MALVDGALIPVTEPLDPRTVANVLRGRPVIRAIREEGAAYGCLICIEHIQFIFSRQVPVTMATRGQVLAGLCCGYTCRVSIIIAAIIGYQIGCVALTRCYGGRSCCHSIGSPHKGISRSRAAAFTARLPQVARRGVHRHIAIG